MRPAAASEAVVESFPLQFASAEAVAQELGKLDPEAESKVLADTRTNSLILLGTPGWMAKMKQRIAELDQKQSAAH